MPTFLLTWNPQKWPWDEAEREAAIHSTAGGSGFPGRWSIGGRTSGIGPGDRVFLLRQGEEPRGLVASGVVTSDPYQAAHWDGTPGRLANYVDVDWDRVLDDDSTFPTAHLIADFPGTHWNTQSSGILIQPPDDGLGMATLSPTWIEQSTRLEPDGGDGWLELMLALVPLSLGVVSIAAGVIRQRWPSPEHAHPTPGSGDAIPGDSRSG